MKPFPFVATTPPVHPSFFHDRLEQAPTVSGTPEESPGWEYGVHKILLLTEMDDRPLVLISFLVHAVAVEWSLAHRFAAEMLHI